ncbi:MAG: aminoacyl-tRNA hydrolase [Methyloceanibacter sp.]|nr:aminoacyl-tRNA hydrolase [Methyloceanibacter sp.]
MKLFVGLGNPGREYAFNRHNVGFMAVDAIAAAHDFLARRKRFSGLAAEGRLGREQVLLLKPQTFMNESGRAVGEALRFYKLDLGDVVVFHDELDLAPGKVRVKIGGGVAGHNGLKSLTAHIGNDYVRVRIGIGHPGQKDRVTGHVLHDFVKADYAWLEPLLAAIAEEAPFLADGAQDKFQSRVAHALQADAVDTPREKPAPRAKPAPRRKEPATGKKAEPPAPQGSFADKLRRWFGA